MVLYNRGYSFYEVINVPCNLQSLIHKKQIWKSLHTKDKKIANIRRSAIIAKVYALFSRKTIMNSLQDNEKTELYDIDKLLEECDTPTLEEEFCFDTSVIESFALDYYERKYNQTLNDLYCTPQTLTCYSSLLQQASKDYIYGDYSSVTSAINIYITKTGLQKPTASNYQQFKRLFMLGYIQYLETLVDYISGKNPRFASSLIKSPKLTNIEQNTPSVEMPTMPQTQMVNRVSSYGKKPNLSLLELAEIYNNEMSRANISLAQKEKIYGHIALFDKLLNHCPIRDIDTDDLQQLVFDIRFLPLRLNKNLSADKIISTFYKYQDKPEKCISTKTYGDYIQNLKTLFAWATKRKYIAENPIDEIDIPSVDTSKTTNKYKTFTIPQLQKLFEMPLFQRHWENNPQKNSLFWIVLIGLYSGARLNEICQLQLNDIKCEDGVSYISINENDGKHVKTKAGIRNIPIHKELINIGFLQFVETLKKTKPRDSRLFANLKPNSRGELSAQPSKWFAKLLEDTNIKEKGLVFHSFRHTVRTVLRNNNCPQDRVQRLCGWEGSNSLSEHYGTISIQILADEINSKLIYEGLDLSKLYI